MSPANNPHLHEKKLWSEHPEGAPIRVLECKEAEHEVIVYCKANPQLRIIEAMDIVFKSMRERLGIQVK